MSLAEKFCLSAAFLFFMTGLLTGIWKYRCMATSHSATAPVYVDIAHRSALLYAFAAILLGQLAAHSVFSATVNLVAALSALAFFGFAIVTYILHGLLRDTENQFEKPHRLGRGTLPGWLFTLAMTGLIVGEVGGVLTLGLGAMMKVWGLAP